MEGYELCIGRDARGVERCTVLPAGVAKVGMFVRLIGGAFLLVERLERDGRARGKICTAAAVLEPVWEGRCYE